jgi:hypothetical protein
MSGTTPIAKQTGFPRGLLEATVDERVDYFEAYTARHPTLNHAVAELSAVLDVPGDTDLVIVYGPPGAGKTTLLEVIMHQVIKAALPTLGADPGWVPIVGFPAVAPGAGQAFNWRDYWRRALLALNDPLVTDKRLPRTPLRLAQGTLPAGVPTKMETGSALLMGWEGALRERHPQAVLIDEAQDMFAGLSFAALQKQLNCLKGQADRTGVLHVLSGTYDLLAATNLNAQLTRRSIEIHLPRYLLERQRDVKAFRKVVDQFQQHLPLAEEPDLAGQWEFLYERSLGCVGVLKQWLIRALAQAVRQGAPTLDRRKHLEKTAFKPRAILEMLITAREAEAGLARRDRDADTDLDPLLRNPLPLGKAKPAKRQAVGETKDKASKPFERTPGRDPVGVVAHGE